MAKTLKPSVKSKLMASAVNKASAFRRETGGNVAMMFAGSTVMLLGLLALGLDMTNAHFAKERLQNTTDAIALLAAKEGLDKPAELTAAAQAYYDMQYPGTSGSKIQIVDIKRDGDTVEIEATNNVGTYFAPILGRNDLDLRVASAATFSSKAIDIALVLDTTGSMQGSKLSSLKTAANGLIDTLDKSKNDKTRMSVVPFSQYVNVGLSRRNAVWLDVPADETRTRTRRDVISKTNCRKERRHGTNDGKPVSWIATVCDTVYGPPRKETYVAEWKGCVGSRAIPLNTEAEYGGVRIPGLLDAQCGTEIQELSKNMKHAKSTVNSLTARGNTYMPAGLAWGWRTLNAQQPLLVPNLNKRGETDKVMVLMTDGENTKSKSSERHNGKNKAAADNTTEDLCNNIKKDKITVYTIAYDVSDKSTKSLLSDCASDTSKFFDAKNAADLNAAFEEIGASLNELRIVS